MPDHDAFHAKVLEEFSALRVEHAILRTLGESTLAQATKTNGRVSHLEDKDRQNDIIHALEKQKREGWGWWKDILGKTAIGMLGAAIGFTALLVLQKTEIVNISIVPTEVYDSLPE